MDKTKELLAVLDLRDEPETPEEIQFQWTPLKVWASKNLFDDPDEVQAFYKGYISLAYVAFRLRDEIKSTEQNQWFQACFIVSEKLCNPAGGRNYTTEKGYYAENNILRGKPIHWIVAALIAKDSNAKE